MANQIPLAEGTNIAGGYLVRDTFGETLSTALLRESAVMRFSRVDRVPGARQRYTVYAGRPAVGFVAEGAAKPSTGAEFTEVAVNVKKLAAITLYTEEILEDAVSDPRLLVNADLAEAFAYAIDANALGYSAGAAIVGNFDAELTNTSQTTELGATGDAVALAVSAAIGQCESNGYRPNGCILAWDLKANLRDSRSSFDTTKPVYTDGFGREPDTIYGLPIAWDSNLDALPAAAGKIAALVGDFRQCVFAMRKDLTMRVSTDATVGGNSMFEQNKVAVLHEMRIGMNVNDLNRAFAIVTNAV